MAGPDNRIGRRIASNVNRPQLLHGHHSTPLGLAMSRYAIEWSNSHAIFRAHPCGHLGNSESKMQTSADRRSFFEFRVSGFGFVSDFGLLVSGLALGL